MAVSSPAGIDSAARASSSSRSALSFSRLRESCAPTAASQSRNSRSRTTTSYPPAAPPRPPGARPSQHPRLRPFLSRRHGCHSHRNLSRLSNPTAPRLRRLRKQHQRPRRQRRRRRLRRRPCGHQSPRRPRPYQHQHQQLRRAATRRVPLGPLGGRGTCGLELARPQVAAVYKCRNLAAAAAWADSAAGVGAAATSGGCPV